MSHWSTEARLEGPGTAGDLVFLLRKSRRNDQVWGAANHTHFTSNAKMEWKMTRCSAAGDPELSVSITAVIQAWTDGSLPVPIIMEDGVNWDGSSDYWVTGTKCITPE